MEIREFATRVLFADTIIGKLAPPDSPLTDYSPGAAISSPGLPGRPPDLVPRRRGDERGAFPTTPQLIDESSRARLLHFFCNHELLAVELMALALLRFPDAPASFRRGVARTLQEEQEHTRWYLRRMKECGLGFGDLPVSRMIWDRIAPMDSPLEFVSRLSLTFEQSNLDYARHYERVLGEAGDAESATILGRIYHDEIAHVGHGLKWLRKWKEERESDWDAFRRGLRYPLSPVRAKGLVAFNADGRRAAGLDEEFILRLKLFQQSRGRTPDVWWFNPLAEDEWAATRAARPFHPSKQAESIGVDLECGFALMAAEDDVALVRRLPTDSHRERLAALGLPLPELIAESERAGLAIRRLHTPRPWAWSPSCAAMFAPLAEAFGKSVPRTDASWFSKATAAGIAAELPGGETTPPGALVTRDTAAARSHIDTLHRLGWGTVVLKSVLGLAGRGHRFHHAGDPPCAPLDHEVLIEPWHERLLDFSAHYDCGPDGVRFVGLVRQHIDNRGRWLGCAYGPKFLTGLDTGLAAYAARAVLPYYASTLRDALAARLHSHPHHGPLGVDAFLYRGTDGAPRLHPVVEINPRWSMGRLTLQFGKRLSPHRWLRLSCPPVDAAASLPPPVIRDGRLHSGALVLTDPAHALRRVLVLRGDSAAFPGPRAPQDQ